MTLESGSVSMTRVVEGVVASLQPTAERRALALSAEAPPDLPLAVIDENRITQVLINLLNNAFKFTPPGGSIAVKVSEEGDFLQVSVTDTGRGIPLEHQSRIFDRLHQVKESDAATEQGMGLGLYLCRELIHLHGGEIWVESEVDRGATFSFTVRKAFAHEMQAVVYDFCSTR